MKKLGAVFCVFLVAVMLSACQAFHSETAKTYAQDEPMTTTVFLQLKNLPSGSTVDTELTNWLGAVRTAAETADPDSTHILTAELQNVSQSDATYTIKLTLTHVPDNTWQKTVRPFKIYVHQTMYNPLVLLPDSDVFTYYIGYTSERRHSSTNANQMATDKDGNYVYLWSSKTTAEFNDVYANRPLYIILVVVGATVIGVIVFLVSRYYDCKKRQKQL